MVDPNAFVAELASQIASHLRRRASEFKTHRLGCMSLDAHPWHKWICLSILLETDQSRKWDIGSWEHQEFADLGKSPLIQQGFHDFQDADAEGARYAPFFRCCAQ